VPLKRSTCTYIVAESAPPLASVVLSTWPAVYWRFEPGAVSAAAAARS